MSCTTVMGDCFNTPIVFVAIFFLALAFIFMQQTKKFDDEEFYIGRGIVREASPYYTTAFQAYPGKYMSFGSNRNHYCLQQHQEYQGYRNCMLYLE